MSDKNDGKVLYEISVLDRSEKDTKVVVEKQTVLATSESHARTVAVRKVPAEYDDKLETLDVVVRPF